MVIYNLLFSDIDTLFSIPLDPAITNGCDSGQPIVITHPDSSQVIHKIKQINSLVIQNTRISSI